MARNTALGRQLRNVRKSLRTLDRALARLGPAVKAAVQERSNDAVPKRRPMKITPERRAQMKLQGAYIGLLRKLGAKQKAKVQRLRADKGVRRAIAEAKRMARV